MRCVRCVCGLCETVGIVVGLGTKWRWRAIQPKSVFVCDLFGHLSILKTCLVVVVVHAKLT